MISLVSVLVGVALVSQQCGFVANALIDDSKFDFNNDFLLSNKPLPSKRPRTGAFRPYVTIAQPPPKVLRRVSGERVVLRCVAMALPVPTISWMRDGEIIEDGSAMKEILPTFTTSMAAVSSVLVISTFSPGEDEYTCVAESGENRVTARTTVYTVDDVDGENDVLGIQKQFLSAPVITYNYVQTLQTMGTTLILPCRANSITESRVFWQDNKAELVHETFKRRVLKTGDLLINDLSWEDEGNYTCVAKNAYGERNAQTYVLPMIPKIRN